MENGELKINSLSPSGYSLYLFIEEVAAKLTKEFYLKLLNLKVLGPVI